MTSRSPRWRKGLRRGSWTSGSPQRCREGNDRRVSGVAGRPPRPIGCCDDRRWRQNERSWIPSGTTTPSRIDPGSRPTGRGTSDARHPAAGPPGTTALREADGARVEPTDVHAVTIPVLVAGGQPLARFHFGCGRSRTWRWEPTPRRRRIHPWAHLGGMGHTGTARGTPGLTPRPRPDPDWSTVST